MDTSETERVVRAFGDALNAHDVEAVMALMTDDCVFENTSPFPDGERFTGQAAVRAFWTEFLRNSPAAHFEIEQLFACGDRCTSLWRYTWGDGYIRGVDVFRVRDGKVAEKLAYVKG